MRLLVNATAYGDPPGGAGVRARELFGRLAVHELVFLLAENTPADLAPPHAEIRRLPVTGGARLRRFLALDLPSDGDLLFTDHYPASRDIPTVITLHDTGLSRWRRAFVKRHLARAAEVVAVSGVVLRAWGVDATVVPNGVAVPVRMGGAGDHLLVCDPGVPHKDAPLARAVARAVSRPLKEVGRGVAWLPHAALLGELAGAAAVLCPSRDEGFGMVPLEALASGRPVVVSDLPAHREVCGDAAFYAPPGDLPAWRDAVERALAAPPERVAAAGRARAAAFSWERAAGALDALIRRRARS